MISRESGCSWQRQGCKMPCESCGVQFSVFRRKRACPECERLHCAACLRRGGGVCAPCRALGARPLSARDIAHLKVRDLQCFLQRQNVSTRGCVEKEELVNLCVLHVNSAAYRRRGARGAAPGAGGFTLKGLTTNINDFINSAFDLRAPPPHAPQPHAPQPAARAPTRSNCYNTVHAHAPPPPARPAPPSRERFTTRPGGEADILVAVPETAAGGGGGVSRSASDESARFDTADCYEIEDLDDSGWEFVTRPADPLPNDSEVLLAATEGGGVRASGAGATLAPPGAGAGSLGTPQRAASELELHRSDSPASPDTADSASLQDEPLMDNQLLVCPAEEPAGVKAGGGGGAVTLERVRAASELDELNVKQLKELLARNRVEYRGCVERAELLERARRLWDHHAKYRDEIDNLPIEECCKICMAAPLECVLLECGHIAACTACSKQLAECPICRQYVVRAVRFFRS